MLSQKPKDAQQYLLPEVVSRLKNLELIARFIVEGFLVGLHKSPFHGFSVEFSEYRQYMPGDNIRDIDWKVYGRTDRYYIKQYEEETNLKAHILLDISGSMGYTSHKITKLQYASYLAAAFSYLFLKQRDAVGLTLFSDKIHRYLPPKSTHSYLKVLLAELEKARPQPTPTVVSQTLHTLAEKIKRTGLIILLSEFLYEDAERILEGLRHFRYYGHEVIVFNILDPNDRFFNFGDEATFVDLETKEELKTQPFLIRHTYQKVVDEFYAELKRECHAMKVDFQNILTTESFDKALLRYLARRKQMY
ncbi:MAG: DUF58 domain-containing protein [Calditrichaceae bacterium]|nr:DUF58 domain-containing protein [Calditrichia bacterium]NUQ43979.1 DUF58 domain-containing protein [Calditrichaceae bacterium]